MGVVCSPVSPGGLGQRPGDLTRIFLVPPTNRHALAGQKFLNTLDIWAEINIINKVVMYSSIQAAAMTPMKPLCIQRPGLIVGLRVLSAKVRYWYLFFASCE